ncbi:MAG: hypothetical protein BGP16_05580 [Sphingobium sp. 66-54]|nr:MAG: hypothetical protein BGP16_05580 [Sphingobium sp. 66-54]
MAALPADIAVATRAAAIVTVQDSAILARFPNARDASKAPATGYCDSAADTTTLLTARAALIGTQGRRRFLVQVHDVLVPNLDAGLPCWRLVDGEHDVDAVHLVGRIEVDFHEETTGLELFG